MIIEMPASIVFEKTIHPQKYKWKSEDKVSVYHSPYTKTSLRISCTKFGRKIKETEIASRQISIKFVKEKSKWVAVIHRVTSYDISMTAFRRDKDEIHQGVQLGISAVLPKEIKSELLDEIKKGKKTTATKYVVVRLDLTEWKDFDLKPWDFLYHTEIYAKELMKYALKLGFGIYFVPKGREFDLQLIVKKRKFILALLSHDAKTESRSKQHRVSKTLLDIAKMLPSLHEDSSLIPVIVTQPFEFDGSWSFTTTKYLQFYERQFGFHFIFTDFKKDWTTKVCKSLLEIYKRIK